MRFVLCFDFYWIIFEFFVINRGVFKELIKKQN
jgi:hypothetical protein